MLFYRPKHLHSMRNLSIYHLLLLIISMAMTSSGLTDLDYHLGTSKYGSSSITADNSFHGSSSAQLSVDDGGSYIRISIYPDEPISLDNLDQLNMWISPLSGDGSIQIELFLDGDDDDGYDSHSLDDARLRSMKRSWSDQKMTSGEWNELDGFDLMYEDYGDDSGSQSLDDYRENLGSLKVVRIYITLYKDKSVPKTAAYFDYIKIGDQVLSFEPLEQEEVKAAPKSVSPGGEITYTITYGNNLLEPTDMVIREDYDPRTVFVSADPEPDPGTNNVWTIRDLPPGEHGQITIKVRTSKPSCKADIKSEVLGTGYTRVASHLSTDFDSYVVTNSVVLSSDEFNLTTSASTAVRSVEGSVLDFDDHGAGFFSSQEQLGYSPSRIFVFRDLHASGAIAAVNISANISGRPMLFNGPLRSRRFAENKVRDLLWKESYNGDMLNISSRAQLTKTLSFFETSSRFSGMANYAIKWGDSFLTNSFAGNFSFAGSATSRSTSRHSSQEEDSLACCPEIVE